jgi:hypothetical protein
MNTRDLLLCSLLFGVAKVAVASAPTNPVGGSTPAPQTDNRNDYFKLGQLAEEFRHFDYYASISESLQDTLREHASLMQKLDVPSDVLSIYNTLSQNAATLPFSEPLADWTQADQHKLQTEVWPSINKLLSGLSAYVAKNPSAKYFYFLGFDSERLGWSVPELEDGTSLADANLNFELKQAIGDFIRFGRQNDFMSMLSPKAQTSVKTIAGFGPQASDPLGPGITVADINKMAAASRTLMESAQGNKLAP